MIVEILMPILQTGAVGAMLIIMVRWIKAKDRKSYELIAEQNKERKAMYASHTELVKEVVAALVDKNSTDHAMAQALGKLSEELKRIKDKFNEKA